VKRPPVVACPTCRAEVPWSEASPWRPFCSARCKGIDLGAWASDRYVIAGEPQLRDDTATAEPSRQ
jgi:endogenous inhibitor of DNA gyrase (YacG/DUF329 family)